MLLIQFCGSTQKKLVDHGSKTALHEAGVYRIDATGGFIKGWYQIRHQPYAVWRHHGARVALLRCPTPVAVATLIPQHAGGLKR